VAPGFIDTDMTKLERRAEIHYIAVMYTCKNRLGLPEEMPRSVFLAS